MRLLNVSLAKKFFRMVHVKIVMIMKGNQRMVSNAVGTHAQNQDSILPKKLNV